MAVPSAFHVMLKPRGPLCNLDCAYCYYLSKENLYPDADFCMTDEVLEAFTRQYIAAQRVPEVTFGWQGGEPLLMGLDFFRRAVSLQEAHRKPEMRILNALQTNGTLLDDDWCRFFRERDFLVGLSLDGPRRVHDAYRVGKGGNPSFDRVMAGLALLKQHAVEFNILTTVHAANAARPLEVYRFLRDEAGARFIQFIPIVQRESEGVSAQSVSARSVSAEQYGRFLTTIFDEWVCRDVGRIFVQIFDVALAAWVGAPPGLCVFDETCGNALILEHNGDLYACDHFVEPRYRLGNILETPLVELVGSEQQRRFGLDKRDTLPDVCQACEVRFVCNGGCPKNRLWGVNYLCEGYKAFFHHIDESMRFMAAELEARRPPANIMRHLVQQEAELERLFAQANRNDSCPCGSGRKFKHCHGRRR
ncbi:MAG: anaerobic sulfatase maturase [Anaerolineae bacterium]